MKVKPIKIELDDEQKKFFKSSSTSRYQITPGKSYLVFSIEFVPGSVTDFTLYRIVDDGGRLLPVPACLMEIVDRRCSKLWQAVYNQERFSLVLEPVEFADDPYLSEAILDGEPDAVAVFRLIQERMESEGR
jgi:hypothetical protein